MKPTIMIAVSFYKKMSELIVSSNYNVNKNVHLTKSVINQGFNTTAELWI